MRNAALLALPALGACAAAPSPPPPTPVEMSGGFECKGDALAQFAGRPATQELGAEMLRVSGARKLRWVAAGMMVTMEFNPERLTVWLKADNRVDRAVCG